ncbi:MAG: hypothetical protein IPP56_04100 [Bacteroidetes bacterium]|nr:hypothetical protein [Bacteroidota bacterium]
MKAQFRYLFYFIGLALLFTTCKKETVNTDNEPFTPPEITPPAYSFSRFDANGLLMSKKISVSYYDPLNGLIETVSKEAEARFKYSAFDTFYSDAGAVTCQGKGLSLQNNKTYLLSGTSANTLAFPDSFVIWNVAGNNVTGIANFILSTSDGMPEYKGVYNNSIPSDISRANGVKIPLGANIVGADSVFITLTSGTKSISKTVGGKESYCEFSNTELNSLPASAVKSALLQIAPVKFDVTLAGGQKMYFANQNSYSKYITIQ